MSATLDVLRRLRGLPTVRWHKCRFVHCGTIVSVTPQVLVYRCYCGERFYPGVDKARNL